MTLENRVLKQFRNILGEDWEPVYPSHKSIDHRTCFFKVERKNTSADFSFENCILIVSNLLDCDLCPDDDPTYLQIKSFCMEQVSARFSQAKNFFAESLIEQPAGYSEWKDDLRRGLDLYILHSYHSNLDTLLANCEYLPDYEIIRIGLEICSALKTYHQNHLLYLDLMPSNIYFTKEGHFYPEILGRLPLLTYTNGQVHQELHPLSEYDAPELLTNIRDSRSDIYSLGRILRIMALNNPYCLNPELNFVINKACNPSISERYQSAAELESSLNQISVHKINKDFDTKIYKKYADAYLNSASYGVLVHKKYEEDYLRTNEESAEFGNLLAQNNIAICYMYGIGTEQDIVRSRFWFQKAADNGNIAALFVKNLFTFSINESLDSSDFLMLLKDQFGITHDSSNETMFASMLKCLSNQKQYDFTKIIFAYCCMYGLGKTAHYEEAIHYLNEVTDSRYKIFRYLLPGVYHLHHNQPDEGMPLLNLFYQILDQKYRYSAANYIGTYMDQYYGNTDSAIKWYKLAYHDATDRFCRYLLGARIGDQYKSKLQYTEAISWYKQVLTPENTNHQKLELCNLIADCYHAMKNYIESAKWYKECIRYTGEKAEQYQASMNIANCYRIIQENDAALMWYQASLNLVSKSDPEEYAHVLWNLGGTEMELHHSENAIIYFKQTFQLIEPPSVKGIVAFYIGRCYQNLAQDNSKKPSNDYENAIKWYHESLSSLPATDYKQRRHVAYYLSIIYERMGNQNEANYWRIEAYKA